MKRSAGWALLGVLALSVMAAAQCDCVEGETPTCFLTFRPNETIAFELIAPIDYFVCHGTSVSPSIWGWQVEAADGSVVRSVTYSNGPVGRWIDMAWDLYDDSGELVPPGYYTIVVMTTDGDVSYPVQVQGRCRPWCTCYCGCAVRSVCDVPCRIPFGELYLALSVGETRPRSGLSFSIQLHVECCTDCSAP